MRTHRTVVVVALAALGALAAPSSQAQTPTAPPSDLGSPAGAFAAFSTDYKSLVAKALPPVTTAELARRLRETAAEAAAEKPIALRDLRSWAALFDLKIDPAKQERGAEMIDSENASYLVDPGAGRFYIAIRHAATAPFPRQDFQKLLPEIRRAHESLAAKIGIPARQIIFTDFRETLAQSTPQPKLRDARETAIESVGATTTQLRAVGGLLVDGSYVRIASIDARRFEMVDVRWPQIRLAPEVDEKSVLAPTLLADRITERVAATAGGKPVSVVMAVVLRPIHAAPRIYYVPSLRVGIQPKSERLRDGYRTDAGEQVYFDLVAGMEGLADRDERDLVPESLERKRNAQ
jgi:hypothetical protein